MVQSVFVLLIVVDNFYDGVTTQKMTTLNLHFSESLKSRNTHLKRMSSLKTLRMKLHPILIHSRTYEGGAAQSV